ncbi:MAG TPA: hypothetical protein VJV05_13065 [Pyrinomonadaceae bacterium]|nr:hypothetical protein [Pyrinomonadaceae bacterium]
MKRIFFCFAILVISLTSDAQAQDLASNEHYSEFKKWTVAAQHRRPIPAVYEWCVQAYDKMIASGVAPSTRVPEEIMSADADFPRIEWVGTVKELNDRLCSGGQKKLNDDLAAKHAPLKAALKADKLRLVIDQNTGTVYSYALAGGKYTDDAKALAAARIWFLDIGAPSNESQYCINGGKRITVRRYTFDAQHKLLGTTEKAYCGDPPASAYR